MKYRALISALAATALAAAGFGGVAGADVGTSNPVGFGFGPHPTLLPTLHITVGTDTGPFTYTAKGYFKVGNKTVARLHSFSGTATTTITKRALHVTTWERHVIRAAARRHHARKTTLTIVTRVSGSGPTETYHSDAYLTIPPK
jgi:hypothetical protein